MFITLKPTRMGAGSSPMEQVTYEDSNHGAGRVGRRRAACKACKLKKSRCTGGRISCDRCTALRIDCVFPTSSRQRTRENQKLINSEHTPTVAGDPSGSLHSRNQISLVQQPAELETTNGLQVPTPSSELGQEVDHYEYTSPILGDEAISEGVIKQNSGSEINSVNPFLTLPAPADRFSPPTPEGSSPSAGIPQEPHPSLGGNIAAEQTNPGQRSFEISPCTCVEDLLHVVEKLDNDDFRLKTLAFDQVLKLQKWLTFNCLQPLGCSNCSNRPTVHSVMLIICERVTNMFQCLSRRLKQPRLNLAETDTSGTYTTFSCLSRAADSSESSLPHRTSEETGFAGTAFPCNPEMFSPEFRGQYSNEEQFHMIKVLAGIQVRNFDKLLIRVSEVAMAQGSQARVEKVQVTKMRLQQAAKSIDDSFSRILETLVG